MLEPMGNIGAFLLSKLFVVNYPILPSRAASSLTESMASSSSCKLDVSAELSAD